MPKGRQQATEKTVNVVFSKRYDISFFGLERIHPFDSRKYGRAYRSLQNSWFANRLQERTISVDRPASDAELLLAHSPEYLRKIRSADSLAAALEVPVLRRSPVWLTWWRVVTPMLWAVRGTILAAEAALKQGRAFNFSGGYHHAKPDRGEGFSLFNDIAIAIRQLRASGAISGSARIAYIDLDAHQGNGVSHQFMDDREVFLFDMFNSEIYPAYDSAARRRIDCAIPLKSGCDGEEYLTRLRDQLPVFLNNISQSRPIELAIYNAGTDVIDGDPLGRLSLTPQDILGRDLLVMEELRNRGIPALMLPSGGYTAESYELIATTVTALL